jgi:transcriptional regulator with XRE-family HTH domain
MASYLDMDKLSAMVRTKRGTRGLRETAQEVGAVSASTLSRVENGKAPDMDTFLLLCDWLDVPPTEFFGDTERPGGPVELGAPESIEIQLRSDKNLDPATANALSALVRAAYRELSRPAPGEVEQEM